MLKYKLMIIFSVISIFAIAQNPSSEKGKSIVYFNKDHFLIEGTTIPDSLKENTYDRLPIAYKDKVREPVWKLSKASSGITVRFLSNSGTIKVKWELLNNTTMNHMAETGIKGIDLYCKADDQWRYVNTARPTGKENESLLVNNMSLEMREYKMFLPLYDGVTKLEIGIDSLSRIEKPARMLRKPIVFYGTSITQGGCASRPGMVYSSVISRKLNVECINFGFSGNGRMEKPIVEVISGIDASIYVIDCVSNMKTPEIIENALPLVEMIRSKRPNTPIIFVEGTFFEKSFLDENTRKGTYDENMALKGEYEKMIKKGYTDIYYIPIEGALGNDHEGTVDGVHFTDLGFMRFADFMISKFDKFNLTKTILKSR
jgi:hypothetical protein